MTSATIDPALVNALRTVAVNGSYNASRALSKWFQKGVKLTTAGFESVPISRASAFLGSADDVIAAIHMPLCNDLTGHILLAFPAEVALSLVDMMIQAPEGTSKQFGELECSCLQETANIVGSAYANSLSKWLKLHSEPGVPTFIHDLASSIVDPLLVEVAHFQDEVLVANTDFLLNGKRLQWNLMLLPSAESMHLIQERCRYDAVRTNALQAIAVNGAFTASRSVSKWLKRGVKITTEGFTRVPLGLLSEQFGDSEPMVGLHFQVGAQLHGQALILMSQSHGLRLVDMAMMQPVGTAASIGEMEQSCLMETGNIIASSFVNSWSTWLDVHIEPAAPQYVLDLPGAILESALADQARVNDEIFMARTDFIVDDQWLEWVFLLLPSPASMRLIETSCQ